MLLRMEDRSSMAFSIEGVLHHDLIEAALRILGHLPGRLRDALLVPLQRHVVALIAADMLRDRLRGQPGERHECKPGARVLRR